MGTMRYKPSDKVRIKSIDWYNENKASDDEIWCSPYWFGKEHSKWCGKVMTISHVRANHYTMKEVGHFDWTDEMIEGLVEEPVLSAPNITEGVYIHEKDMKWTTEYILPDGYIFKDENGNVINATKIVLEKKKMEYPKTYEECRDYIESCYDEPFCADLIATGYKSKLIESFARLLICRDAYWKLYGDEMGLGKPWEPDYTNTDEKKFSIWVDGGKIKLGGALTTTQMALSFPTEEMRDAFYENFKELINECKELL